MRCPGGPPAADRCAVYHHPLNIPIERGPPRALRPYRDSEGAPAGILAYHISYRAGGFMTIFTPARATALALAGAAIVLVLLAASPIAAAHQPDNGAGLRRVRAATARYHDLAVAEANGY